MPSSPANFDRAIRDHDRAVRSLGAVVWIGAEPTFTDRLSEDPAWLSAALGADKEPRAQRMLADLYRDSGGVVLRTVGRQYPGEQRPRWSVGVFARRDGKPVWSGPPDPLAGGTTRGKPEVERFGQLLAEALEAQGWHPRSFRIEGPLGFCLAFRLDAARPIASPTADPRLARASIHDQTIPPEGLRDSLAEEGIYLLALGLLPRNGTHTVHVELPACPDVLTFCRLLERLGRTATDAGLGSLILQGFPPPVDASIRWLTLTPDPAVVEVNLAPAPDASSLLRRCREVFTVAQLQGLSPFRLQYNGTASDSGGGGHLTLGGPSPARSPFFVHPHLLPRLVGYFNRHPSLSYYFAFPAVGRCSQAPRPDERGPEDGEELALALRLLFREPAPGAEVIWGSLAPFLADSSGNSHRSEMNIEKLWNPDLPGRGRQGLVEFRAFRMQSTPERLAALAALLRALCVMASRQAAQPELVHWGRELHDRFTLPFYLRRDLDAVLDELAEAGLGLGQPILDQLREDDDRILGSVPCGDCQLTLKSALEIWPLVGDVASQETGTCRLVDSSTSRVEIALRPRLASKGDLEGYCLVSNGYRVPLLLEKDREGSALVFGIRYRGFLPRRGLHPTLGAQVPLVLDCRPGRNEEGFRVTLHEWRPDGNAYDGLPRDPEEARRRRQERVVVTRLGSKPDVEAPLPPAFALGSCYLDLRRL